MGKRCGSLTSGMLSTTNSRTPCAMPLQSRALAGTCRPTPRYPVHGHTTSDAVTVTWGAAKGSASRWRASTMVVVCSASASAGWCEREVREGGVRAYIQLVTIDSCLPPRRHHLACHRHAVQDGNVGHDGHGTMVPAQATNVSSHPRSPPPNTGARPACLQWLRAVGPHVRAVCQVESRGEG